MKDLAEYIPAALAKNKYNQASIPEMAKNDILMAEIANALQSIPTMHTLYRKDCRQMDFLTPNSVHLA